MVQVGRRTCWEDVLLVMMMMACWGERGERRVEGGR